jgi:hypothetical protein
MVEHGMVSKTMSRIAVPLPINLPLLYTVPLSVIKPQMRVLGGKAYAFVGGSVNQPST